MDELPAELQLFDPLLDAQPPPAREAFQYSLCLMMIEAGKMKLVNTIPGDEGPLCYFETMAGEAFTIRRPAITAEEETRIVEVLRDILSDEELL